MRNDGKSRRAYPYLRLASPEPGKDLRHIHQFDRPTGSASIVTFFWIARCF